MRKDSFDALNDSEPGWISYPTCADIPKIMNPCAEIVLEILKMDNQSLIPNLAPNQRGFIAKHLAKKLLDQYHQMIPVNHHDVPKDHVDTYKCRNCGRCLTMSTHGYAVRFHGKYWVGISLLEISEDKSVHVRLTFGVDPVNCEFFQSMK